MGSLRNRTVVITGASAGVGRAAAREYGAQGAKVALLARGLDGLEATREEIQRAGGRALAIPTDVADADAVDDAAARVEAELGPIDIWVNNAMSTVFAPFEEIEPEEFERSTRVTYLGYVWGTRAALRRMRPRDRGVVVQVGSALAYRGIPLQSSYCGAKHAIRGFTDSLRTELRHAGSGVRLCAVHLPALNTPQFEWSRTRGVDQQRPVPPVYQPEVAARAIVTASQRPHREVWVGAPTAVTIIGNKVAPRLGDWYLGRTGFGSQQMDMPPQRADGDNLFAPVPGDQGAHGRFDEESKTRSPVAWISTHRGEAAAGVGLASAVLVAAAGGVRRGRRG